MECMNNLVKVAPYRHQIKATEFALEKFDKGCGVALLMEMGCGKSLTSIMIAGNLYKRGIVKKVLVVCPLSITGVWESEFEKYANYEYELTVLKGSVNNKKNQLIEIETRIELDGLRKMEVIVVNYDAITKLEKDLLSFSADLIIADEGHKLKSGTTARSKTMHVLGDHSNKKLLLTGTAISNSEIDIFSQYRFLDTSVFGFSFYKWRNYYFTMGGYQMKVPIFKKALLDDFLKRMHSIAFRVKKSECLDLPPITEEIREIELEDKAMKVYRDIENELYAKIGDDKEITTSNILVKILRLSQLTGGYLTDDNKNITNISKAKLEALIDIIDTSIVEDKKLVIIARFSAELDAIEELLKSKNIDFVSVRGGTNDRDEKIDKFQNDEKCKIFLGQIATVGLGITLTASSTMVFYSMDYSMSNFDQCKARIHRAGQTKNCHYIYLIAKHSIDKKVLRAIKNKVNLSKALIDDYRNGIKTSD